MTLSKLLERRLDRLEARAVATGPKAVLFLEARAESGNWTGGGAGRWVAGSGEVYHDADLKRLAATHFLILVSQHGEVNHDD